MWLDVTHIIDGASGLGEQKQGAGGWSEAILEILNQGLYNARRQDKLWYPLRTTNENIRGQVYWTIIRMTINLMPSGGRRYMAQEGTTKLLNPELEEPTA